MLAAKIEIKDPRLIKQKSLEHIQRRTPLNTGSQEMLQYISFDRSSRTVSPSNLKPISPTPFPNKHRQEDQNDAQNQQRESRKRQLEADDTTATQPRLKMQLPAILTTPPTPPGTQMQQSQGPPDGSAAGERGVGNKNEAPTEIKVKAAKQLRRPPHRDQPPPRKPYQQNPKGYVNRKRLNR
ncbi:hypothetical protein ACJJTC_017875 [Scirpophaga incertulas]